MKTDLTRAQVRALLQMASSKEAPASPYADLLDRVVDSATTTDELTRIKEVAKGHLERAEDRSQREDAAVVYHAAVAAAFVRHGTLISGRPMRKQREVYQELAERHAGEPLGQLFRDALARLADHERT